MFYVLFEGKKETILVLVLNKEKKEKEPVNLQRRRLAIFILLFNQQR